MASDAGVLLQQARPGTQTTGRAVLPGPPDLWGGLECSVVRLGESWRDQVCETGHHARGTSDLDRITGLGITTLRYPVLWERVAAGGDTGWAWHDRQLGHLRRSGVTVIAGLMHHGSGPAETNLLDPHFAEKLAAYADTVAERYPFITAWTPVNEPLTTARFSCLYGYWYPHVRDEGAFLLTLVNQCRGILLATRALRRRCPDAQFVHTEDIGRVFSTPPLARQARYENERRWRWLMEAWTATSALRGEGIPIQAVTAWALFGLVDWDSLLRERRGRLEPGAFDTRIDPPRPTEIAAALEALAREGCYLDSCLEQPGWWRRDDRFRAGASA